MKSVIALMFVAISTTGCTVGMIQQAKYQRDGNPRDVAFCRYEAQKSNFRGSYVTQTGFGNALEEEDRKAEVFNACMAYKSSGN